MDDQGTIYSFSRIDDILLQSDLAETCKTCYTCDLGYLSDHIPLMGIIPTNINIGKTQTSKNTKQATLIRPVSASDHQKLINALSDPSHGIMQKLGISLQALLPVQTQALAFLNNLESTSANCSARLQHINGLPAEEQVEHRANSVTHVITRVIQGSPQNHSPRLKSTNEDQQYI